MPDYASLLCECVCVSAATALCSTERIRDGGGDAHYDATRACARIENVRNAGCGGVRVYDVCDCYALPRTRMHHMPGTHRWRRLAVRRGVRSAKQRHAISAVLKVQCAQCSGAKCICAQIAWCSQQRSIRRRSDGRKMRTCVCVADFFLLYVYFVVFFVAF